MIDEIERAIELAEGALRGTDPLRGVWTDADYLCAILATLTDSDRAREALLCHAASQPGRAGRDWASRAKRGAGMSEQYPYLMSVASQRLDRDTSGESKRDHGCTEEEYAKGNSGRTLCGRLMAWRWFSRHEQFTGEWNFHCRQCVAAARKRGLLPASQSSQPEPGGGRE